jgi:hypothetical protein
MSAAQTDMRQRLALVTKLQAAMDLLDQALMNASAAHNPRGQAQALAIRLQLPNVVWAVNSENLAITQDQQALAKRTAQIAQLRATAALEASEIASLQPIAAATQKLNQENTLNADCKRSLQSTRTQIRSRAR